MQMQEIPLLSAELSNEHIEMPYPHLKLHDASDAVALMLPELPQGDLPVICEFKGVTRQIGSVRKSALVFSDLLRISRLSYVISSDTEFDLTDTDSIFHAMEV